MKKLLLLACLFTLMQAGTPTSATPSPLPLPFRPMKP